MSYRENSSEPTNEDRSQHTKANSLLQTNDDFNLNGNNNTGDGSNGKSLVVPEGGRRGSKSPARNRKSKLITAMAANFEKKNNESDGQAGKSASRRSIPNGETKVAAIVVEPAEEVNNQETDKSAAEEKKASSNTRRGKAQRSKRQLRQKRRSTGVVNKEDLEEIDQTDTTEADHNLKRETDVNTQTNEQSPSPSYGERLTVNDYPPSSPRNEANNSPPDSAQSTPRRSFDNNMTDSSKANDKEMKSLQTKLDAAELTITRLQQEIKIMDKELRVLEEENDQLREENKLLEDENRTMLRIIKS